MLKKIDTRKITTKDSKEFGKLYIDIYSTPDNKEVIYSNGDYYYLSKDGLRMTTKKYIESK